MSDKIIGIVGSGKMGSNIAGYFLDFDFPMVWICEFEKDIDTLTRQVHKKLKRSLRSGLINKEVFETRLNQIIISHNPEELKNCRLIIETINEDVGKKRKLFAHLDKIVNKECIFASNSSSIMPEEWYPDGMRKEKIVGMHFFFPIQFTNISELIITSDTNDDTIQFSKKFLDHINRKFILQKGEDAFLLNKIFIDLQAGSYKVCQERSIPYHIMDSMIVRRFFPVGVFELFDRIGIDIIHYSIDRYTRKKENRQFYDPLLDEMKRMIDQNKMGIKTGEGFYQWEGQQKVLPEDAGKSDLFQRIEKDLVQQLSIWYVDAANYFVQKGSCSENDLNAAIKEYMNVDKGPFDI